MSVCNSPQHQTARSLLLVALVMATAGGEALGQSCADPLPIAGLDAVVPKGDTCSSENQLPFVANGAIAMTSLRQNVYRITVADGSGVTLGLFPDPGVDLALFVCPNECSTFATCIAAADAAGAGGKEEAPLPPGPGVYYLIVSETNGVCGGYQLSWSKPL